MTAGNTTDNGKWALAREAAIFQFKLLADGLRDAALIPVSLVAALVGLVGSSNKPDRHYRKVIDFGKQTERWIDLFGHHEPLDAGAVGSLDRLIEKVETVVAEEYKTGNTSRAAANAIEDALHRLERRAHEEGSVDEGQRPSEKPQGRDQ